MSSRLAGIRKLVLATNRWPLFATLNRIPYYLAVRSVTALCGQFPEIASLHVKGSFAHQHWTAGLSDIDLFVVVRSGLDMAAEFALLVELRREYKRRLWWFPMLGELEIVLEDHLATFSRNGFAGYDMRYWRLLHGARLPFAHETFDDQRLRVERMRHALRFFRHHFPQQSRSGSPETRQRLNQKVCRVLEVMDVTPVDWCSPVDFMAQALNVISEYQTGAQSGQPVDPAAIILQKDLNKLDRRDFPTELKGVMHYVEGIVGIFWDAASPFIVLRDGLEHEDIVAVMSAATTVFDKPVVMNLGTFQAYLHWVEPLLYFGLLRSRILWGQGDPLAFIEPPSRETLTAATHRSASDAYIFSFSDSLLESVEHEKFRSMLLGWLVRMLRYLEEGIIDLDYSTLEEYLAHKGIGFAQASDSWCECFSLCRTVVYELERLVAADQSGLGLGRPKMPFLG